VLKFRADTRLALETFLRFTHRYWFHEVSHHKQAQHLFNMCRGHLEVDQLYNDVREEVQDMSQYLEAEAARRQNETMMRLTVVTTFGLIGTVATGFLGMNLFSHAEESAASKLGIFLTVFVPTLLLTFYLVAKSRRQSEFLDAVADARIANGCAPCGPSGGGHPASPSARPGCLGVLASACRRAAAVETPPHRVKHLARRAPRTRAPRPAAWRMETRPQAACRARGPAADARARTSPTPYRFPSVASAVSAPLFLCHAAEKAGCETSSSTASLQHTCAGCR
jgi:hypothetical protein